MIKMTKKEELEVMKKGAIAMNKIIEKLEIRIEYLEKENKDLVDKNRTQEIKLEADVEYVKAQRKQIKELELEIWKLKWKIGITEWAYFSLLHDYNKVKEDNEELLENLESAKKLLDVFIR